VSRLADELRDLLDRCEASRQQEGIVLTEQEVDHLTERYRAEMELLRLRRETLILDAPHMMLSFVSSCETDLHRLWLQVQWLVMFLVV